MESAATQLGVGTRGPGGSRARRLGYLAAASLCACQLSGPLPLDGESSGGSSGSGTTSTSNGTSTGGSTTLGGSTGTGSTVSSTSLGSSGGSSSGGSTSEGASSGSSSAELDAGWACPLPGFIRFLPQVTYAVGSAPHALAAGDFNGDGRLDLVVANGGGNDVSTLLGQGDGSFLAQATYATGSNPTSVAVGDLNGDGKPDLAIANSYGSAISVLLNLGDGGFGAQVTYAVPGETIAIAETDLLGDGSLDLVVVDPLDRVDVLFNQGDGTFAAAVTFGVGSYPASVAVGDLNGDGKPDVVVGNRNDNTVSLLFNQGDGGFAAQLVYSVGGGPNSVALGDFNGDGELDLAVANSGSGSVSVLLNAGGGVFGAQVTYSAGGAPVWVTVGDFSGDGALDLAVTNSPATGSPTVQVLLNQGAGFFGAPVPAGTIGIDPQCAAAGDFDGDGRIDLATANWGANDVSVLLNPGVGRSRGTLLSPPLRYAVGTYPGAVAIGDFNDDGEPDLVVANETCDFSGICISFSNSDTVSVLLNVGDAEFGGQVTYAVGNSPAGIAVGDWNGDGWPDLAVANEGALGEGTVGVLLNQRDGGFGPQLTYAVGTYSDAVAAADFDGDGKLDLAVVSYDSFDAGTVSLLLGHGDGTFAAPMPFPVAVAPIAVAVGDFDGDGRLDLAVANGYCSLTDAGLCPGSVSVLLNLGGGSFAPQVAYPTESDSISVAVGDFNGDGKPDLAVANEGSATVSVLLNLGDGGFAPQVAWATGPDPYSVAVGDFNGDGHPDLAVARYDNAVVVLLNDGGGSFGAPFTFNVGLNPVAVAVGDFNRDGLPDLAVVDFNSAAVSVLLNSCGP